MNSQTSERPVIAAGFYPWIVSYKEQGKEIPQDRSEILAQLAEVGIPAWEDMLGGISEISFLKEALGKYEMSAPTIYVNARLHQPDWTEVAEELVNNMMVAERSLGTSHLILNPEPVDWNEKISKTDTQLRTQAEALNYLAGELGKLGVTVDYHQHDKDFIDGAREFHHMMLATEKSGLMWNLDVHWVFMSYGYSQVALEDCLKLYGHRIASVHLRQSINQVWTEYLCDGDVDYGPVVQKLVEIGFRGPLTLEAARQKESPDTVSMKEAHQISRAWVERTFAELLH